MSVGHGRRVCTTGAEGAARCLVHRECRPCQQPISRRKRIRDTADPDRGYVPSPLSTISMRRFLARPSGVSLEAIGLLSPNP